ncbi:two-component system, sporulation sensor kinase B [Mariprofundus micogutta]|uniref:histidine kinase n=2 Tax=Mariprofundus micogutta TaxID=1921010 RepID=A0A1L8CJZ3_9PROT|nr:two-component system, sporulation sensor kinase B [Mariprofundus micogutta]
MHHNANDFPLLDHVSSGVLAIDLAGNIVLWNKTLEQWYGENRESMLGKSIYDCFPLLKQEEIRTRINSIFQDQDGSTLTFGPDQLLFPCTLSDGKTRAQQVTVSLLTDHALALFSIEDQSNQYELVKNYKQVAKDLQTELEQKAALESRNARLISAIDQAGEAVVIINHSGDIEYVNKAFYQQTGWNKDEIDSISFYNGLFADRYESFKTHIDGVFTAGETWQGRQEITCKDGSSFTASISIAPITDQHGNVTHSVIIQEDISQQVIVDEKLRHSQKQEALITLVGGIAHDFNNLLAGLVGQAYLAAREVKAMPKTAERLKKIQMISQEASEIVKQLLTFARQGEHESKEFPLDAFIKEFSKLAQHTVPESIKWSFDFNQANYAFRGDANQLQQSLLNIVQNAVEACSDTAEAQISLILKPLQDDEDTFRFIKKYPVLRYGNFAHILIKDNGCGIMAENLSKVFDPFYSTKQLGSGLGLAIVMGCVRHHHGIIDVNSKQDEGTSVHLFLPMKAVKPEQDFSHPQGLTSAKILLVDDDTRVLEPTKELLESMGHDVELACDGQDACEKFESNPDSWDIVITDMVMPRMNGLDSAIRMRSSRPDIPIIFATGYDQSLVIENTRKMKNSVLIGKPFNPDELDQIILKMIKKS